MLENTDVLCLVYPMLPVSLDFPFFIAPSVFSNMYLKCYLSKRVRSVIQKPLHGGNDCPPLEQTRNGRLNQILKRQTSRFRYGSKVLAVTITQWSTQY
jgi:hypothetical protein